MDIRMIMRGLVELVAMVILVALITAYSSIIAEVVHG